MAGEPQRTSVRIHDKRDTVRKPKRVMVRYGTRRPDKTAFTRNISLKGLFIQTNSVLNPGSTLQVQLLFADREFTMWARVRWAKSAPGGLASLVGSGMGVQFVDPPEDWLAFYRSNLA